MALIADSKRVIDALTIGAVNSDGTTPRITRGWPKTFEVLPCLAVSEASNRHFMRRDNADYVEDIETDIRVFAVKADEIDTLAPQVESVMAQLGYIRRLCYEDLDPDVKMKLMRYRIIM